MTLEIAWWLNIGVNVIAGIIALALIFHNQWIPNLHHAIRRGKLTILGWSLSIYTCSILLSATFLLDQGTMLRTDAVLSYWARWAWYIPMSLALFYIVSLWCWHGHFATVAGLALVALSTATQLFAVLSISAAHWVWFFLSLMFCVALAAAIIVFKRRFDPWAWIGIGLFVVPAIVRPIIMGLGHHLGGTLSIEVETWVFTIVDCLVFTLYPLLIWYKFCPISITLIEHPEINGMHYAACPPKCKKVKVRRQCPEPPRYQPPCASPQPPAAQSCVAPPPMVVHQDPCAGTGGPSMWQRMQGMAYRARPSDTASCASGQCERPLHPIMPGSEVQQFNAGATGMNGGGAAQYPFQQQWDLVPDGGSIP